MTAIELNIPHISAYCLTIEEKTVFGKWYKQKKLQPADEDIAADQFELLMKTLTKAGYHHYEISNFAKPNLESRHNSSYWQQSPYIGIGPGAHSYNGENRQYNISNNPLYIKSLQKNKIPATVEILTKEEKINEYILTCIRTSKGIDLVELKNRNGINLLDYHKITIEKLIFEKLLLLENSTLLLSSKGKFFADKITEDLMV